MRDAERCWAFEEFGHAELGDRRRTARLVEMAAQIARRPEGKVSEVFRDDAARQGAYDFLESAHVDAAAMEAALGASCAERAAEEEFAFVPLDGSTLSLTDRTMKKGFGAVGTRFAGRGLKVMTALALDPRGVPLGVAAQRYWAREDRECRSRNKQRSECARRPDAAKETQHWVDAIGMTCTRFDAVGAKAWFVGDREADSRQVLLELQRHPGHRFTIRAGRNRRVLIEGRKSAWLRPTLRARRVFAKYAIDVPAGPGRTARTAVMQMRVMDIVLRIRTRKSRQIDTVRVTAVWVREHGTAPFNEAPLDWMLLTNAPVTTAEEATQVLVSYSLRWRIEELHKAWKSGTCNVELTQLRSKAAVVKWATLLVAVAARAERLKHLARTQPDAPASIELSKYELRALLMLKRKQKKRTEEVPDEMPSIAQATRWLADLGGYTGKSSGGPPGAITIGRGLADVLIAATVLEQLDVEKSSRRR